MPEIEKASQRLGLRLYTVIVLGALFNLGDIGVAPVLDQSHAGDACFCRP